VKHSVNLSAYAGQSVLLQIVVVTDGTFNSNYFVDDVSFQGSASSSEQTDDITPHLDASTTQSKIGNLAQGEKRQSIHEKPFFIPR
jgi:predicted carbohydrate-binding protein with CBM5 and CBM33 domain